MCMLAATVVACGGGSDGSGSKGSSPVVTAVTVTPASTSLAKGLTQQYVATAQLSDNSTQDISASAAWTSSASDTASVNDTGLATTHKEGSATIKASFGGLEGSADLTVTAAVIKEIQITGNAVSVPKGLDLQFTATAVMTDNSTVNVTSTATWKSSDTAVASVDTKGLVSGIATGTALISATSGNKTGSVQLTVVDAALTRIEVAPTPVTLAKGGYTQRFVATGIFSDSSSRDISTQVTWASSNTAAASISNASGAKGLATSAAPGTTKISAQLGTIKSSDTGEGSDAVLTVTADVLTEISVEPAVTKIALGRSQQYAAIAKFSGSTPSRDITDLVSWASSDQSVATISNAASSHGLAVSQSEGGPVTISAERGGVSSGTSSSSGSLTVTKADLLSLEVSPADVILPKGFTREFAATGTYSDGSVADVTDSVTWLSSNSNVATISNAADSHGLARGGAAGNTTITAVKDGKEQSTLLTVSNAALARIDVAPDAVSVPLGATQAFAATGVFDDGFSMDLTGQVSWQSADANIASVSNVAPTQGVATAKAQGGPVAVTAAKGTISGNGALTVTSASITSLTIRRAGSSCASPTEPADTDTVLPREFKAGFLACATYTDGKTRDVTAQTLWSSQATSVVTISNDAGSKGVATGVAEGRTVVVATLDNQTDTAPIQATTAVLNAIDVTPKGQTLSGSGSIQYQAVGTFSDASTLPITTQVTWSSSSTSVAISNAKGSEGRATPSGNVLTSTSVTITAARGTVNGTTTLTRTP